MIRGVDQIPADAEAFTDELAVIAREAMASQGLTVGDIARTADTPRFPIARLATGTWRRSGITKQMLKRILRDCLEVDDCVWARAQRLFDQERHSQSAAGHYGTRIVRYGRTEPFPPGRRYASIDRLELEQMPDGRIWGFIERIEPETRRGATWESIGYVTPQTLLLTFSPSMSPDDATPESNSSGAIVVQREPDRRRSWPGAFIKLERHSGRNPDLAQFAYWLSPPDEHNLLVDASSTVAVLDLDNTLAEGWIMVGWLRTLAEAGLGDARHGANELDHLFTAYRSDPEYGHDRLAREAARIYAASMSGVESKLTEPLATALVSDYLASGGNVFPSTTRLISGLRDRGIRPVLITGAPSEVVSELATELGIGSVFPLTLEQRDGRFTGAVEFNHGLSTAKRKVCRDLREAHDCNLLVAVGDSEGDRPMWDAAEVSIRVGGVADARDVTISGVDLTSPLDSAFWAHIPGASWIEELDHPKKRPPGS